MTYYESAEGVRISRGRACQEARAHGVHASEWDTFLDYLDSVTGKDGMVGATEILAWLGY